MHERPVWAEIDLSALAHNMREFRRITNPMAKIMAIVKANAYGHGVMEASRVFLDNGAAYLGVAFLGEALEIRRAGIGVPLLILGYTPPEQAQVVVENDITQAVFDVEMARILSEAAGRLGKKARIHIKIDTGMGRIGFLADDELTIRQVVEICRLPHLEVEGVFSHLASADEEDKSFAREQLSRFTGLIEQLASQGIQIPLQHIANSAAIMEMPESHLSMVRPGISLYGLYPSDEVDKSKVELRPAMSWKARVIHIKEVPAGFKVSYGCTYRTRGATVIATLPLGYADGFTRLLSAKGEALIGGRRVPVVGRVCMDQCMLDVGEISKVAVGDEVVLIGRQGGEEISAEEMAQKIGTINYEVVCRVSSRVPREYVKRRDR